MSKEWVGGARTGRVGGSRKRSAGEKWFLCDENGINGRQAETSLVRRVLREVWSRNVE